jgi:hypothetical protein
MEVFFWALKPDKIKIKMIAERTMKTPKRRYFKKL